MTLEASEEFREKINAHDRASKLRKCTEIDTNRQ